MSAISGETVNERRKRTLAEAMAADPAGWTPTRVQALYRTAGDEADINTCWGWLRLAIEKPIPPADTDSDDALFGIEAFTTLVPPCTWCGNEPATVCVRVRPNLLALGPFWSWDLAGGDDQALRSHTSAPCCDGCARYLDACWQIRNRLNCGQFRESQVIWFVPLASSVP